MIKICVVCGKEFEPLRKQANCCSDECRRQRNIENMRVYNKTVRKERQKQKAKKQSLDKKIKELEKYNKKHGTHLSYGQYQSMLYIEQLKSEKETKENERHTKG